jgi:EAL domain-containing protein (putative c-di-GMP-specific phosphodiesterase class I)
MTSASVGASIYPLHGKTYESLRRSADHAMYQSKRLRKGGATYFEDGMACVLSTRMDLEQRLRSAIRNRLFHAAYQPKVDLFTGKVQGFEALIRWVQPDGKVHMPSDFIELATELGVLDELTHFMFDSVIADLPRLKHRFGGAITVSVNIGARQAGDVHFMDSIIRRIDANLGRQLVLELTEDALVAAHPFQKQVLPRLRELGVRVSIDDFGTGYSSLAMLSDVTVDEVKVDRAFVSGVQERSRSQGILRAIESLCGALQIDMVAEGVETPAELAYLREHSTIRCAQGYLFARPAFVDDILDPHWATGHPPHTAPGGGEFSAISGAARASAREALC